MQYSSDKNYAFYIYYTLKQQGNDIYLTVWNSILISNVDLMSLLILLQLKILSFNVFVLGSIFALRVLHQHANSFVSSTLHKVYR